MGSNNPIRSIFLIVVNNGIEMRSIFGYGKVRVRLKDKRLLLAVSMYVLIHSYRSNELMYTGVMIKDLDKSGRELERGTHIHTYAYTMAPRERYTHI